MIEDLLTLYNAVEAAASGNYPLYTGHPTKLAKELGFSGVKYNRLRRALVAMGCITIHVRGSRAGQSVWELHHTPSLEKYMEMDVGDLTPHSASRTHVYEQRQHDLLRALGGISARLDHIEAHLRKQGYSPLAQTTTEELAQDGKD